MAVIVSCACAVAPLPAQTAVQFTVGATSSGVLVNDGVVHTKLRPGLAPTVGLGVALPTGSGPFRVRLEAHLSRSNLNVTTADGASDNLGSLTTIDALVMAEGPLVGNLRWQVGGGALFYRAAENQGVFLDGPVRRWLLAGGAIYSQQLTSHYTITINGRVDAHSFLTDVLQARNFAGSQGVRRFVVMVGVERAL